jgi:translation elongation factor EF-G
VLTLLDYAILVVSAPDGVQNHTRTLLQLLEHYSVPTFLFVNKTDLAVKRKEEMEDDLRKSLSPACVGFYEKESTAERDERLSMLREDWMEAVLEGETIEDGEIAALVSQRKLFPVLFGAALRLDGVAFLLDALDRYAPAPVYEETAFGAKVYKIHRAGNTRRVPISAIVHRLALDGFETNFRHRLRDIDDMGVDARGGHTLLDVVDVFFIGLSDIGGKRDDLHARILEDAANRFRIQSAGNADAGGLTFEISKFHFLFPRY